MPQIIPLKNNPEYASILAYWAFKEWYIHRAIEFDIVIKAYKERINESRMPISWIAMEDRIPAGMVSLKENDLWSRKDLNPWLSSLYVVPEYRGRGIGSMLTDALLKKTSELKYQSVYLFCDSNKPDLNNYYRKAGWDFLENAAGNDGDPVNIYYYKLL